MSLEAVQRNGHRLELGAFEKAGVYDIPVLYPEHLTETLQWVSFNRALTFPAEKRSRYGVHFFVDDYIFERVWRDPTRYALFLREFAAVMSPDFSMYTDWPRTVQIYNHWRKHQLGAYWQRMGLRVIPSICWSDAQSFDWCFDGEPVRGTVAVSSVGTQKNPAARQNFLDGFTRMTDVLQPDKVVFFGSIPKECKELSVAGGPSVNIESHSTFYAALPHALGTGRC